MFRPVPSKMDFPAMEREILQCVPAGDLDVDLPVTVSFQGYLSGHDPVLEAISSR